MSILAIETNGLTKRFGDVLAVDRVDLRVGVGEIYDFLGLNGAGKITTIRALLGMIRPSAGNVKVLEQALGPGGRGRRWRTQAPNFSVADFVLEYLPPAKI